MTNMQYDRRQIRAMDNSTPPSTPANPGENGSPVTPTQAPKLVRSEGEYAGSLAAQFGCTPGVACDPSTCEIAAAMHDFNGRCLEESRTLEEMYKQPYKPTLKPYSELSRSGRKYRRAKIRRLHSENKIELLPPVSPVKVNPVSPVKTIKFI